MDTSTALALFATYQRAKGLAARTVTNRESLLRGLERRAIRPLLACDSNDLLVHLGRAGIAKGTRRTERDAFRAFYAFARARGYIDLDPSFDVDAIRVPRSRPRPFTPEQIQAMLTSGAYARTRAMISLGYLQGFRVSQIARAHGHDFDLAGGTVYTIAKGGKEGTLPLHQDMREIVERMPRDSWWFPARRGVDGPIKPESVTNLITRAKHRAGIHDPRLTPHSLRHSFGSHLVEAGADIRVVQELMMHESLTSTQIYTAVTESMKRNAIAMLSQHRRPPSEPLPLAA